MRVALGAVVTLLLLTGCAGTPAAQDPAPGQSSNEPTPQTEMVAFGQTHRWPNGDTIAISKPRPYKTAVSDPARYKRVVVVDVEVHNGGPAPKEVNSYVLNAAANDTEVDGLAVGDLPVPAGAVPPGGKRKYTTAYQIPETGPVTLQVQASGEMFDPQRPAVFFSGTA
jgi:hypothetical protein